MSQRISQMHYSIREKFIDIKNDVVEEYLLLSEKLSCIRK